MAQDTRLQMPGLTSLEADVSHKSPAGRGLPRPSPPPPGAVPIYLTPWERNKEK